MKTAEAFLGCEFIRHYKDPIYSLASKLKEEKYDVIIALSRKAPRLLELLSFFGIDYGKTLVLTERSIYFIPKEFFVGKKVLILDDIIIVGTTIYDKLKGDFKELRSHCNELAIRCLAIDTEWFQDKFFAFDDVIKSPPEFEYGLKGKETAIFCNELVRSFRYLNKPYDIDYSIFYTDIEESLLDSKKIWIDELYELSTVYQSEINRRQFTFIPPSGIIEDFVSLVLHPKLKCSIGVGKCRLYYNTTNKQAAFAPMLTVSIENDGLISSEGPFNPPFDAYNKLFNNITAINELDEYSLLKARYSLFWYILSYLWGINFASRNNLLDKFKAPSMFLKFQDMIYLFGHDIARNILDTFNRHFDETVNFFESAGVNILENYSEEFESFQPPMKWDDEKAQKLYEQIKGYIDEQKEFLEDAYLIEKLAVVSEGLFYKVELETRKELNEKLKEVKSASDIDELLNAIENFDRLKEGFTWGQIKGILDITGLINFEEKNVNLRLSLALDLLVDLGVIIPIQYFNEKKNRWERRYRFGEDALAAQKTASLFWEIRGYLDRIVEKMDKISLEKIFVLLLEKARKEKYTKEALAPKGGEEEILVDIGMCIHGAVLQVENSRRFFSSWLEDPEKGRRFLALHHSNDIPLPEPLIEDMLSYTKALAYVDNEIDKPTEGEKEGKLVNKESRYLITISTLYDYEPYLDAIREEIRIFFSEYFLNGETLIQKLISFITDLEPRRITKKEGKAKKEELEKLFKENFAKAAKAANSIILKHTLFPKRKEIAHRIDDYFRKHSRGSDIRRLYFNSGKEYSMFDKIQRIIRSKEPKNIELIKKREKEILHLGEVCKDLSLVIRYTREILHFFLTRTKERKIHGQSKPAIENRFRVLREKIVPTLNQKLSDLGELFVDMRFSPIDNGKIPDTIQEREVLKTISYILSEAQKIFVSIEPIYKAYFSEQGWKVQRERLFPLSSDEHYLLISYDIKRSSRTPEDIKRRRWIVQDINRSIIKEDFKEDISKRTIVPVIELRPHESGTFLAKTENRASLLILKLLQKAKGNGKNLRVGVSSTLDTNIPFKLERDRYDDEDELIVTADEDPEIDMNYNVLSDLLNTAEKKEDREENEEEGKIEGLKEDIPTIVLSEEAKSALDTLDNEEFFKWISIKVPREKGGKKYNGFIVRPEYVDDFIRILQSLAVNIP